MYCEPTAFDRYILCTFPFVLQWIFQHLLIINCMFHWCHHSSKWFREEDLCLCVSSSLSLSLSLSHPPSLYLFLSLISQSLICGLHSGTCFSVQQLQMAFPKTTVQNKIIIIITTHIMQSCFYVILHYVIAVGCILITEHCHSLPPFTNLMCHNADVWYMCTKKMLGENRRNYFIPPLPWK